ncbi:MAG TPA: GNAT family N-acetyltransferase [Caulobacteraceae bacterium]
MSSSVRTGPGSEDATPSGAVAIVSRAELARSSHWRGAFANRRKDHRFYELVEDTLNPGFDYRYFAIVDEHGEIRAVQPFFILDQDLLAGVGARTRALIDSVRRAWPRLLTVRTLMVGCVAGEGHLDGAEASLGANARLLASAIVTHARDLRAPMIVIKEFPKAYREPLKGFLDHGFSRIPSLPMTRLNIDYADFEDYMTRALNSATRRKLRKKFRIAAAAAPIEMSVVQDATPVVDEIYPLYLQVYERSKLHFEKLTKAFLCGVGALMPERTRFFIWRQNGRIVAFSLCMLEGEAFWAEYIGLDYSVALRLHLYHYAVRDMTSWAMARGYKEFRSSALNYDPKLHLRHRLDPIDLYVRHVSPAANAILKAVLPVMEPTRYDPILKMFPNYDELWG